MPSSTAKLREIQPNFYFNAPSGFDMPLPYLDCDEVFARDFFECLEGIVHAGAALPQTLWEHLVAAG